MRAQGAQAISCCPSLLGRWVTGCSAAWASPSAGVTGPCCILSPPHPRSPEGCLMDANVCACMSVAGGVGRHRSCLAPGWAGLPPGSQVSRGGAGMSVHFKPHVWGLCAAGLAPGVQTWSREPACVAGQAQVPQARGQIKQLSRESAVCLQGARLQCLGTYGERQGTSQMVAGRLEPSSR